MPTSSPWFKLTSNDGGDMTSEVIQFAEMIGIERAASGRYSILLLLALFGGAKSGKINPAKVVHEIQSLEGLCEESHLKPASLFKHAPLQGLWHKHYLQDGLPSMAINLRKGINKNGLPWLEQQIVDAKASGVDKFLTEQDCAKIAYDAVIGNWGRLVDESALTGEWIIFAKHQGKNYYLCLGEHTSGDDMLRSQIDAVCVKEYPFLVDILT
jgi:hypothetical protein